MFFKKVIKNINLILMIAAFFFIFIWIYKNIKIFTNISFEISFNNLLICLIFVNLFHFSQILIWILNFKSFKIDNKFLISKLYFWNNIYNYLPNRIFHFGGILLLGKKYGFDIKKSIVVIINFQIFLLISGIIVILPYVDKILILKDFEIILWLTIGLFLLVPIFKKYLIYSGINLKFINTKYWYESIMISVVSWFLYSYGLFSLFKFLDNDFHMNFLNFNSISVFSNLLGSFVIFMPAGIGALETAFINLINDIDKAGFFLTALVLFRLLTILSSALLMLILNMTNKNDNT